MFFVVAEFGENRQHLLRQTAKKCDLVACPWFPRSKDLVKYWKNYTIYLNLTGKDNNILCKILVYIVDTIS